MASQQGGSGAIPKTSQQTKTPEAIIPGQKRKFDLDEATLGPQATPEATNTTKRVRTTDTPVTPQAQKTTRSSPGIQDMLDSKSGELNSAERKKQLAIAKKVEGKAKRKEEQKKIITPAKRKEEQKKIITPAKRKEEQKKIITPAKRKEEQKKIITPGNKDWGKLHQKQFDKLDGIDVYQEKKLKRAEELTGFHTTPKGKK